MAAPLSPLSLSLVFKPKPLYLFTAQKPFSPLRSSSPALPTSSNLNLPKRWKISGVNYDFLLSEANPVENSQEIVATSDDGVSTIISSLLFVAFVGLSVLTIGVIYIAVTDFLQKREGEKLEKEEAAKKKRSGKRGKLRARSRGGPRGFGQKIEDDNDDDDVDGAD
ncbi:transmembrane protein [Perilla frutescens var. hirtella]|nr:transmembrane protein [Perilla frutescens var. hirtella]KAH6810916.1 transmembrane protein [Perilla frutescens var. frutescens]